MLQAIAAADTNPVQTAVLQPEVNRFDVLEGYIGTNLNNWQVTVGKQNLWWGPEAGGPLLFSDNAEAIPMVRVSQLAPVELPWIFRYLGALKVDLFFGQLAGHQFPGGTIVMHGEKISLKPTPNLELGFSRTSIFGGDGRPLTLGALVNSYIGYTSSVNFSASSNPGKRMGAFDFSYRLPFVRNWLSIYADSITPDDPSPIDAPRRAAVNAGLYASHIPGIPRLDLRFEGGYTDTSTSRSIGGKYIYWEQFYHDLYTNDHQLMGSWIGREGQGFRLSSRYWFNAKNNIQVEFRRSRVDPDFVPSGGSLTDFALGGDCWVKGDFAVSARVQYERWLFPVIQPAASHNVAAMLELRYQPEKIFGRGRGSQNQGAIQ
jgi:hypothetical protein